MERQTLLFECLVEHESLWSDERISKRSHEVMNHRNITVAKVGNKEALVRSNVTNYYKKSRIAVRRRWPDMIVKIWKMKKIWKS